MREQPPAQLIAVVERLGLANAAQVARMGRRVKRLARDLPRFESVWVDALLQARVLTPFQAAEMNAGRGESLRVGPYVLQERLPHPYYVACYRARNVEPRQTVMLAIVENAGSRTDAILRQLDTLRTAGITSSSPQVGKLGGELPTPRRVSDIPLPSPLSFLPFHCGIDAERVFVAVPWVDGRTTAEWMVHHGRFPPEVVLEIARAMLANLVELERVGVCHGDVSIASLIVTDSGGISLSLPGVRGILRPEEGYAHGDLLPEGYDSLSPERIVAGTPPDVRSDIYACGCVWWQLLCGRPPLAGGNSLAKLRAAQAGEICDVRRYAPDVPPPLAAAITACLEREPTRRPESFARLADMLGSPTRGGKEALADCLARAGRPTVPWTTTVRSIRRSNHTPLWIAGAVCCLAAAVAVVRPFWHGRSTVDAAVGGRTESKTERNTEHQPKGNSGVFVGKRPSHPATLPKGEEGSNGRGLGGSPPSETSGATSHFANVPSSVQHSAISVQSSSPEPVVAAAYQQAETRPPDLVLAADKPVTAASLDLRPGQCVRGPFGKRATVVVPRAGLAVDKESVCFQHVDFVWRETAANDAPTTEPAIVQVLASRAEFRGCSFRCEDEANVRGRNGTSGKNVSAFPSVPVPAIRWIHPTQAGQSETSLPSGRLQLSDCLLHCVSAGLDCRTIGAMAIELKNVLHLDAGPLVRLDHCPQSDEPVSIVLGQVTLRGGGPLIACLLPRGEEQPGEIAILATACAFVPDNGMPLIGFSGEEMSPRLPTAIRWSGQGSLVGPSTAIIAWRGSNGQQQTIDESALSIAGLVRSEVGFAGQPSGDPAASRLVHWQAPLQSADPPGIDPAPLPSLR